MTTEFQWTPVELYGKGWFLSDLHLGRDAQSDLYMTRFLDARLQIENVPDWICLGGDTFDFMAGANQPALAAAQPFLEILSRLAQRGVQFLLLEGNHDFHLADALPWFPDNTILATDGFIDPGCGLRFVHGDYQTRGAFYDRMRRVFRSRVSHWVASNLPDKLLYKGATTWSHLSHAAHGHEVEEAYLQFVGRCMAQNFGQHARNGSGVPQTWLMGHIHVPMRIESGTHRCFVNGYWPSHHSLIRVAVTEDTCQVSFHEACDDGTLRDLTVRPYVWR